MDEMGITYLRFSFKNSKKIASVHWAHFYTGQIIICLVIYFIYKYIIYIFLFCLFYYCYLLFYVLFLLFCIFISIFILYIHLYLILLIKLRISVKNQEHHQSYII